MRKILFLLVFLFLLVSPVLFAQEAEEPQTAQEAISEQVEQSPFEIFSKWQVITVLIMLLSVVIISIVYSGAQAFDMPDLKAWAQIEAVQVIVSALLLIGFIGILFFFDGLFMVLVNSSSTNYHCVEGAVKGCSAQVASEYINGLVKLAQESSSSNIQAAYIFSKEMGQRYGWTGHTLLWPPLLWYSFSSGVNSWQILNVERLSTVTDYYGPVLASLYAQNFFVTHLSYNVGPYLLVLGLLTRSFFATRKLGGLLIAIAVAVMFVFPLMYVFDALTLSITAYADNPTGIKASPICPTECTIPLPIGYYKDPNNPSIYIPVTSLEARDQEIMNLSSSQEYLGYENVYDVLMNGTADTAVLQDGTIVYGCGWPDLSDPDDKGCPPECRGNPYPAVTETCQDIEVKVNCDSVPDVCKRNLIMDPLTLEGVYLEQWELCTPDCKTLPPLSKNCNNPMKLNTFVDLNLPFSFLCPILLTRDDYRTALSQMSKQACVDALDELAEENMDLFNSDFYRLGSYAYTCSGSGISVQCSFSGKDVSTCEMADARCRVNYYGINQAGEKIFIKEFPDYCTQDDIRLAETCSIPPGLKDGDVINEATAPYESCIFIAPVDTENCVPCMFVDDPFTYSVPVIVDCVGLCGNEMSMPPSISSASFAQLSSQGMYGMEDIKSVSGFLLPAYILPLFNILVTIMFIKTFSPLLGGDIEIPGISRVF